MRGMALLLLSSDPAKLKSTQDAMKWGPAHVYKLTAIRKGDAYRLFLLCQWVVQGGGVGWGGVVQLRVKPGFLEIVQSCCVASFIVVRLETQTQSLILRMTK